MLDNPTSSKNRGGAAGSPGRSASPTPQRQIDALTELIADRWAKWDRARGRKRRALEREIRDYERRIKELQDA